MIYLDEKQSKKREKTMLLAFLLSAPGPIVTAIPAINSLSATQIADFLRRTSELSALFMGWWSFRNIYKYEHKDETYRKKMQHIANSTVGYAMIFSALAMFVVGVARLFVYEAGSNVIMGLVIASMGLVVNTGFWLRYKTMNKEHFDIVVEGQQKLYSAKAWVDSVVVIALSTVAFASSNPMTKYIDGFGGILVGMYLFYTAKGILYKNKSAK